MIFVIFCVITHIFQHSSGLAGNKKYAILALQLSIFGDPDARKDLLELANASAMSLIFNSAEFRLLLVPFNCPPSDNPSSCFPFVTSNVRHTLSVLFAAPPALKDRFGSSPLIANEYFFKHLKYSRQLSCVFYRN